MIIRTIELAHNIKATLKASIEEGYIKTEWEPDMDVIVNNLPEDKFEAMVLTYRLWRNEVLSEAAKEKGMQLVEVPGLPDIIGFRERHETTKRL